ncbi:Programmed cell death protein 2, partial [Rhizophlyctis rosea]
TLCTICGLHAPKHCSRCKRIHYCSREHQLLDWNSGGHKAICLTLSQDQDAPPPLSTLRHLFSEHELVSEEEPEPEKEKDGEEEVEGVGQALTHTKLVDADEDADFEETNVVDKAFMKFQKRVEIEPDQVVRYARVSYESEPPTPLYVSSHAIPTYSDLPPCPTCHAPRTFEFQIMPQLLNFLDIDHSSMDALDWGTVMVFSCQANCWVAEEEDVWYLEEVVWRQEFSKEGMGDNLREAHEMARKYALEKEKVEGEGTKVEKEEAGGISRAGF